MAVGRANYNGTTTNGATKKIANANASRQRMSFSAIDGDMVLNFGADATATDVLSIVAGGSITLDNRHPYDIRQQINVYAAGVFTYQCQCEEMSE